MCSRLVRRNEVRERRGLYQLIGGVVVISESVSLAAEFALRGWLSVVHVVMHGLESAQIP